MATSLCPSSTQTGTSHSTISIDQGKTEISTYESTFVRFLQGWGCQLLWLQLLSKRLRIACGFSSASSKEGTNHASHWGFCSFDLIFAWDCRAISRIFLEGNPYSSHHSRFWSFILPKPIQGISGAPGLKDLEAACWGPFVEAQQTKKPNNEGHKELTR